jgi:hypothetical protein
MKVIKSGDGKRTWGIEKACTGSGRNCGCNAILLIEEDDLFFTYSSHYDGGTETYITFRCPECGEETDIDRSEVPDRIIGKIKDRRQD